MVQREGGCQGGLRRCEVGAKENGTFSCTFMVPGATKPLGKCEGGAKGCEEVVYLYMYLQHYLLQRGREEGAKEVRRGAKGVRRGCVPLSVSFTVPNAKGVQKDYKWVQRVVRR